MNVLTRTELQNLATSQDGWHVSIFMPTHRVGDQIQQNPIRLKNLLAEAEQALVDAGLRQPEAQTLLAPGRQLLQLRDFWRRQSDSLALFISSQEMRPYRLPYDFKELALVSERFHTKPLLPLLSGDGRFYLLALSQGEIRLLQGSRYSVGEIDLDQVPEALADVLRWDDPERRLQWHSGAGQVPGRQAAIFHGHGVASADDPKDNILRYFHKLDRGLQEILAGETAPLVLAGVDYLLPLYQEANSYPHLVEEGILGNPEEMSAEGLHQQAWEVVAPIFEREREQAAARYKQLAGGDSDLASTEVEKIVPAAYYERVDTLFVPLGQQRWGAFDPESQTVRQHQAAQPGDRDLLDLAAVHTLLNGGTVYAVAPQNMPAEAPLAAVLRY